MFLLPPFPNVIYSTKEYRSLPGKWYTFENPKQAAQRDSKPKILSPRLSPFEAKWSDSVLSTLWDKFQKTGSSTSKPLTTVSVLARMKASLTACHTHFSPMLDPIKNLWNTHNYTTWPYAAKNSRLWNSVKVCHYVFRPLKGEPGHITDPEWRE